MYFYRGPLYQSAVSDGRSSLPDEDSELLPKLDPYRRQLAQGKAQGTAWSGCSCRARSTPIPTVPFTTRPKWPVNTHRCCCHRCRPSFVRWLWWKERTKKNFFFLLASILIGVDEDEIAKRSNGSVDTNLYYIESVGLNFHRRPTIDSSLGRSNCSLGLFSTPLGVFLSVSSSFLLNRPFWRNDTVLYKSKTEDLTWEEVLFLARFISLFYEDFSCFSCSIAPTGRKTTKVGCLVA